jgi:hypothetical protein
VKNYYCQKRVDSGEQCGLECAYIAPAVGYAAIKKLPLTGNPPESKRVLCVDCPVHGQVPYEIMGHHITMGWGKRSKDSGRKT